MAVLMETGRLVFLLQQINEAHADVSPEGETGVEEAQKSLSSSDFEGISSILSPAV